MRNLKRALSLAVASVMLLGMMVVGTGAAGYVDVSSEDNQEAIDVMQAVNIMTGVTADEFDPDGGVTRGQMAVIMTKVLDLNTGNYSVSAMPFTDVPDWAKSYVAAIYAEGVTGGISDTLYGTDDPVTAAQAALMLMKALGYFQYPSDLADGWLLATIRQAGRIDLFDGIDAGAEEPLTRSEVAQLVLNTLKATMVEPEGSQGVQIGDVIVGSSIKYVEVSKGGSEYEQVKDDAVDLGSGKHYVQLGEELFDGELKCDVLTDDMGRPANVWSYKNDTVGKYTHEADFTIVVDKAQSLAKEIEDLNRSYELSYSGLSVSPSSDTTNTYVNGKTLSGNLQVGDVVEVFMSDIVTGFVDTVSVTRYSVAQLSGDVTTKGEGDDLEVRVPGVLAYTATEDVVGYQGLVEDDVVYYYEDNAGVTYLAKAESFDSQLTSVKSGTPAKYVIGGADYVVNGNAGTVAGVGTTTTPSAVYNTEYRYYLDNNGYIIFAEELEDALSDYVIIQEIKYVTAGGGIGDEARVEARLVKMDGTTEIVTLASVTAPHTNGGTVMTYTGVTGTNSNEATDSDGNRYLVVNNTTVNGYLTGWMQNKTFFTYEVNSDDEYELTYVHGDNIAMATGSGALNAGKVTAGGSSIAVNDSTVFVVAKEAGGSKFDVYTGKNNAPDMTSADIAYVREGGVVTYVYINNYSGKSFTGNYVFILDTTPIAHFEAKKDDGTTYTYNTYKAVVNGAYEEVKVSASALGSPISNVAVDMRVPTYNDEGVITNLAVPGTDVSENLAFGYKLEGTTLLTGKTYGVNDYADAYVCEDGTPAFIMDEDGDVTETTVDDLRADANDAIYVILTNTSDNEVDFVFVEEKDADETGIVITASDNSVAAAGTYAETIDGESVTVNKYTVKNGANVTIAPEAGCAITTSSTSPYWSSMTSTLTYSSVTTGSWIAIKVVAEDSTITYYSIEVIA